MSTMKIPGDTAAADYTLTQILNSPNGFEKLAELLPQYIKSQIDYTSFCRKILNPEMIEASDTSMIADEPHVYYAKDQNARAAWYAEDMQTARYQIEGTGVNVPIGTISSDNATIDLKRLKFERYPYLNRQKELAAAAVQKAEDVRFINLVETLLQGNGTDVAPENSDRIAVSSDSYLNKAAMADLRGKFATANIPIACYLMHPIRQNDVLKWEFGANGAGIDDRTQREILEEGQRYKMFGLPILTSIILDENVIYAFGAPEYVGRMPIAQDATLMTTETRDRLRKGLFIFEFLGMYLANVNALAKLIINDDGTPTNTRIHKIGLDDQTVAFATGTKESDAVTKGMGSFEESM